MNRSLFAAAFIFLVLPSVRPAAAQDIEKACRAMSDAYATIEDATRCAKAHGWQVSRYWVQISEWSAEQSDRGARAERGERTSTVRIMCGAPSYVEENGVRNALWETKAITRRFGYESEAFTFNDRDGLSSFEFFVDAANAACGSLFLNARPRAQAGP